MQITVDPQDRRPIYLQVVDEIKSLIAAGELRKGVWLPPLRQLAADLGVNLNTIAAAYRELQAEGLITVRHGSGAVVASTKTGSSDPGGMRKLLRTALTRMVLGGMERAEIQSVVADELRILLKGK
jgi:GntR family transcriptional regulator